MAAQKLKVLIAAMAAMVLILAAGVAYANSSQPTSTTAFVITIEPACGACAARRDRWHPNL
jgi:hypothetical protein